MRRPSRNLIFKTPAILWKRGCRTRCLRPGLPSFLLTIFSSRIFPGGTPSPSEDPWNQVSAMSEHQRDPARSCGKPGRTEPVEGMHSCVNGTSVNSTVGGPLASDLRPRLPRSTMGALCRHLQITLRSCHTVYT